MFTGILKITINIDSSFSLKDRRRVVQSLKDKISNRFNAAVADITEDNTHNLAKIGIAVVSGSSRHADEQIQQIINYVEKQGEYVVIDISEDLISVN